MKLSIWLRYLKRGSTAYPNSKLLPRPSYRLLLPPTHHVSTGWLLRRVSGKNAFTATSGSRLVISDPKQLCDEPNHLSDGFSVNLWGHFEIHHNGWKNTKLGQAKIFQPWVPPQSTQPPTSDEMQYLLPETWDTVGFDIAALHDREFSVAGFGLFHARVCHAPNCWNYWHYEVRFQNNQGQWLGNLKDYNPKPYSNKQVKLLQAGLLSSFIESGLAKMVTSEQAPIPLNRFAYDRKPPLWIRLFSTR